MDDAGLDVAACLVRVRDGDAAAARDLFHHLLPLVTKLVRSHLPRRTSEEDLVQAIFMRVFSRLNQFSGTVPLEHWVSRIAINTCLNQIERERVRPELRLSDLSVEEESVLTNLATSDDALDSSSQVASRELVDRMLAGLNPPDRLVITLLHLEGRSLDEIRAVTGWSTTLIKVRAFRARQRMKKHLLELLKEAQP